MKGKNITLLCYEKNEEICDRKFVKNIYNNLKSEQLKFIQYNTIVQTK